MEIVTMGKSHVRLELLRVLLWVSVFHNYESLHGFFQHLECLKVLIRCRRRKQADSPTPQSSIWWWSRQYSSSKVGPQGGPGPAWVGLGTPSD